MNTSPLLINESPLQVLPSLAEEIGLNEAIALQQLHYWVSHNQKQGNPHHFHDARWWSYNTAEEWKAKNFPFWSIPTIKRTFKNLCDRNLVLTAKLHKDRYNHTKWYTIDYEVLNQLWTNRANRLDQSDPIRTDQSDPIEGASVIHSSISTETNNPETITQTTTTERPKKKASSSESANGASLLEGEALEQARAVADMVAQSNYRGRDGNVHGWKKTTALVEACAGHSYETAGLAIWAFWENIENLEQPDIKNPQAYITKLLREKATPSPEYEATKKNEVTLAKEAEARQGRIDYIRRWLPLAEAIGFLEDVSINEDAQFYSFRYADETTVRNCNLWDVPPLLSTYRIEELQAMAHGVSA